MLISGEAIDLISRILQERQYRLCSDQYEANDLLAGRHPSPRYLYSMDSRYADVTSYYVYPDDATGIKAHPFFKGIPWNELHLIQPPMIPRVRGWEDTRYFADMESAAKANAAPINCEHEVHEEDITAEREGVLESTPDAQASNSASTKTPPPDAVLEATAEPGAQQAAEAKKKRSKDRPRDKILRDGKCGPTALEIRKRGTFLGYTYRRPKRPAMALSAERGRRPFIRPDLADLYST